MLTVRSKYCPGFCEYRGGYKELRWDVSGCNLRCHFCWSPASRPAETDDPSVRITPVEVVNRTRRQLVDKSKSFIRFTGGEPTLQWSALSEVLAGIHELRFSPRVPILIQTNGIEIGKGTIALEILTKDSDQPYLFELSFKGTHAGEFALLTGKSPDLFDYQLKAYEVLGDLARRSRNVRVVAVLGVYHSSTKGPSKYAFVNPGTGQILFEDSSTWDPRFRSLWQRTPLKWVEPLRMSPLGVWKNILRRCGTTGAGIIRNFPGGIAINTRGLFPMKPKSFDYAHQIVTRRFWR